METGFVYWIMDFVMIFLACFAVYLTERWIEKKRDRELDIGCDYCEEIKRIYRTPDKRFWLCHRCCEAYMKEQGFTIAEKEAVRAKYHHKPSRKIMPKKKKRSITTKTNKGDTNAS